MLETITAVTVDLSADTVRQAGQPALDVRVFPLLAALHSLLTSGLLLALSRLLLAGDSGGGGGGGGLVLLGGHEVPLEVDVVRVVFAAAGPLFVGPVFPGQTGRHGWRSLLLAGQNRTEDRDHLPPLTSPHLTSPVS